MRVERRVFVTAEEMEAALIDLAVAPRKVRGSDWPGELGSLDVAGMYSWWTDDAGAHALTLGLGVTVGAGRIYAGQTGATKWPSGKRGSMTLRKRIGQNHLRGRIRSSTFRRTLASALREVLDLRVIEADLLDGASERRLTAWIADHLEVAVHPFPHPDALADLEQQVLVSLDPPLNLASMPPSPVRVALVEQRRRLRLAG